MMLRDMTNEEILKNHPSYSYVRTDRNGTRYFSDCRCQRCGGRGVIPGYEYIEGGVCFECGGSGRGQKSQTVKVYTEKHEAELEAKRIERMNKRIAEKKAQRGSLLERFGFGHEGDEYVIYRVKGDTYSVKDFLKAQGCKFNGSVGWYTPAPFEGFEFQRMTESQVLEDTLDIMFKNKWDIEPLFEADESNCGEFVGEVGERSVFDLHIAKVLAFDGFRGATNYMHLMFDEKGNEFVWTTSARSMEEDSNVRLKGTIKDHKLFKGKPQTVLTRCTII